jgi:hypothetical protein
MAVTKIVNIKVNETGLDEINKDLVSLDKNINKVDDSSKDASKGLKDVGENGGAIAVLDSLTGGLATRIRDAAEASKLFNFSLKGMRTALIATGIGAFVVAVGLVVAYWDEIKIALSDTNFLLGKQIENLEKVSDSLNSQITILDKRMELNKLEGKSNEELQKQKIQLLKQEQAINGTLIEKLEWQLENEKALAREVTLWERIKIEALRVIDPTKAAALEAVSQLENTERTFELQQKINESKAKQVDLEIAIFKEQNPESIGGDVAQDRNIGGGVNSGLSAADATKIETAKIVAGELLDVSQTLADKQLKIDEDKAARELLMADALAQAKVDIAQNTLALIGAVAGEGSKVGKAVAVAQATISGSTAQDSPITKILPAYPFIQAGLAGAFSAIQIKKILSTDPTGKTQPNLGGAGGGGGASAPSFNVVGTSPVHHQLIN